MFKHIVDFEYAVQRKLMCDQWCRVDFPVCDKPKYLVAVTSVHTAGLERQVFPVHIG